LGEKRGKGLVHRRGGLTSLQKKAVPGEGNIGRRHGKGDILRKKRRGLSFPHYGVLMIKPRGGGKSQRRPNDRKKKTHRKTSKEMDLRRASPLRKRGRKEIFRRGNGGEKKGRGPAEESAIALFERGGKKTKMPAEGGTTMQKKGSLAQRGKRSQHKKSPYQICLLPRKKNDPMREPKGNTLKISKRGGEPPSRKNATPPHLSETWTGDSERQKKGKGGHLH